MLLFRQELQVRRVLSNARPVSCWSEEASRCWFEACVAFAGAALAAVGVCWNPILIAGVFLKVMSSRSLFGISFLCLVGNLLGAEFEIVSSDDMPHLSTPVEGVTLVEKGNAKGQTFACDETVVLKRLALKLNDVTSSKDITLRFMGLQDGSPSGKSLLENTSTLPVGLVGGQTIQMTFERPLVLQPGKYAFLISTESSKLKFSLGRCYSNGCMIRKNVATKKAWRVGRSVTGGDLVFRLDGLPMESLESVRISSQQMQAEGNAGGRTVTLKRYENPKYEPGSLSALGRSPNIITVMVDDLGWNQIGVSRATFSSNSPEYLTPNLARLADEGLCFTNAYAQPNCAPTRAAMLTGQYPARIHNDVYVVGSLSRHGRGGVSREKAKFFAPSQSQDVALEAVTIAEALKRHGYQTAHIGKYHVGGHKGEETLPENVGFDINIGGYTQGHQPVCFASEASDGRWEFRGLGRGNLDRFAVPYDTAYLRDHDFPMSLAGSPKHISDAVAEAMEETVKALSAKEAPFYVQVHPYAVHGPVQSRPDLKRAAGNDAFYGFVRSVDSIVGRVLKVVEDPDGDGDHRDSIAKHTMIIFTSDNGGTHKDNWPLRGTKGMFTEGGIRVPLIAWWPGRIPAKTVTHRLVHTVDYYPTYLELSGGEWRPTPEEHPLDGVSFAGTLLDPEDALRKEPVFYLFPGYLDQRAQPCAAVIDQVGGTQYKLLYYFESDAWELYNITEDIGESVNIANESHEISSRLAEKIRTWLNQDHPLWKPKLPLVKGTGKPASIPAF